MYYKKILQYQLSLSDRTMLSEIFNAKNLTKINLFYFERPDEYIEKTFEISRHFRDKETMRKKIVPKELSIKMPQIIKKP